MGNIPTPPQQTTFTFGGPGATGFEMPEGGALVPSGVGSQESILRDLFSGLSGTVGPALGNVAAGGLGGIGAENLFGQLTTPPTGVPAGGFPLRVGRGVIESLRAQGRGVIPDPIQRQFQQNLEQSLAEIRESFGTAGARFGTDLGTALGQEARRANVDLGAEAIRRSQQAAQVLNAIVGQNQALRSGLLQRLGERQLGALQTILDLGRFTGGLEFTRSEEALNRALEEFKAQQEALGMLPGLIGLI